MAQSQVNIGQSGPLAWESSGYAGEIPSSEIWRWSPVAPGSPEPPAQTNPGAATKITQVLVAWRAAESRLQDFLEASPMRTLARSEVARLRAEYQRLFALAIR
jgi:hypothetical protein